MPSRHAPRRRSRRDDRPRTDARVRHGRPARGQTRARRRPRDPADAQAGRGALAAGALGFSTSRTLNHHTAGGAPTPTLDAAAEELIGIAGGLADAGGGIIELISDLDDVDAEFETFREMMRASGRPLRLSLNQEREDRGTGQWRKELDLIEQANLDGLPMRAQVAARGIGLLMGLQSTINPFAANPVWREVSSQPHAQQVAALLDSQFRRRLVEAAQDDPLGACPRNAISLSVVGLQRYRAPCQLRARV